MEIITKRLRIVPLSLEEFCLLLEDTSLLERSLGLEPSGFTYEGREREAMDAHYRLALENPNVPYWYTNWQIILKSENRSIGSACFMRRPDENGEVEIGYGINEPYRNKGYMTEAASALCRWCMAQPEVRNVVAQTEKDNVASHRVLQKCNMNQCSESEESFLWKLNMLE